jgi:hypothetical protein
MLTFLIQLFLTELEPYDLLFFKLKLGGIRINADLEFRQKCTLVNSH